MGLASGFTFSFYLLPIQPFTLFFVISHPLLLFTALSYMPHLLFRCYSCCLVKAGVGDLLFLIDLKIPLFYLIWLFSKSRRSYQNLRFDDAKILFIYLNISMMSNKILIQWFWVDVTSKKTTKQICKKNLKNWTKEFEEEISSFKNTKNEKVNKFIKN